MHRSIRRLAPALAVALGAAAIVLGLPTSPAFAAPIANSVIVRLDAEASPPVGSNVITVIGHCPSGPTPKTNPMDEVGYATGFLKYGRNGFAPVAIAKPARFPRYPAHDR